MPARLSTLAKRRRCVGDQPVLHRFKYLEVFTSTPTAMITLIAGARPNFMKVAPIIRALDNCQLSWRLVHTGQHYDARMSNIFFDELKIPHPDVNLGVGAGSHLQQLAEVMRRLEGEFSAHRPAAVVVVGDVNSTMAAALAANKLQIPVAHVEAGLRSGDRTMPEEINRVITDAISDWLFTSEPAGEENLHHEGIDAAAPAALGPTLWSVANAVSISAAQMGTGWKMATR